MRKIEFVLPLPSAAHQWLRDQLRHRAGGYTCIPCSGEWRAGEWREGDTTRSFLYIVTLDNLDHMALESQTEILRALALEAGKKCGQKAVWFTWSDVIGDIYECGR